jgi:hypothetical protein
MTIFVTSWLTPREAASLAGVKAADVEIAALRHGINRCGEIKNGRFVTTRYSTADLVSLYRDRVPNWKTALRRIEFERIAT